MALLLLSVACHDRHVVQLTDAWPADQPALPAACAGPSGDADGDGIPNSDEGCAANRDTDQDNIPDWQDSDSDNDGIPDAIEKGEKDGSGNCEHTEPAKNSWPCDTDGDAIPDCLDADSDGDCLLDGDEDANGDGLLGCCLTTCNSPGAKQQVECVLSADGCGPGQECHKGACTPAILLECANGETSPTMKDTFGVGKLDGEGSPICRDATDDDPQGRKPVQLHKSVTGDWHVALRPSARYDELKITSAGPKEAAGVVDEDDLQAEVAGFVLSRDTVKDSVQDELTEILQAIGAKPPGGTGTVSQHASGTQVKSHDLFDSIQGTILDVTLSTWSDVSTVRNELVGTLMSKSMAELGNLPSPYGSIHTEFVIRFVSVKRVELQKDSQGNLVKDAKGYPVDSGDKSKWRLVIMGAVASKANYQDPARVTGFIVDDLSSGTALARSSDKVFNECDVVTISSLPVADIIWVVDESGSMIDNRQDIVNNANNFFSRALASGLDFRMGVTGVCNPTGICSMVSSDQHDDGGADRFLLENLEELLSLWLVEVEDTRSPEWHTTLEIYASAHWLPRWQRLGDINTSAIQKYISERLRSKGTGGRMLSPVTLAKELSGLRRFLKWCKRHGHLAEIPTWEAPEAKSDYEPVYLSRDQMMKVLAELSTRAAHHHHLPVRACFTVMWATSFRLGTMARLRWEDVSLTDRTVTVDKKRMARVVPLTEEAVAELQAIAPGVGLVFGSKNYRASLRAAARRAGIPEDVVKKLGNHSIRHSRLTDLASRSKNIAAIQHMAGHKDLASTTSTAPWRTPATSWPRPRGSPP